jgi:hypothetical protein
MTESAIELTSLRKSFGTDPRAAVGPAGWRR